MANANLLLHLNTDFSDSGTGHTPTIDGATYLTVSTDAPYFGVGSAKFDAPNQTTDTKIVFPSHADFDWAGDFTVDCWVKHVSTWTPTYHAIWSNGQANTGGIELTTFVSSGFATVGLNGNFQITGTTNVLDGNYHHIAVTRTGTSLRLFIDGVQEGITYTTSDVFSGNDFWIGQQRFDPLEGWTGYIDEFRAIKGTSKWSTTFTPRIVEYENPEVADFLLHLNTDFTDAISGQVGTLQHPTASAISIQGGNVKFGAGASYHNVPSASIDSRIEFATNASFDWAGDFTVDCWAYFNATWTSAYQTIWSNGNWATSGITVLMAKASGVVFVLCEGDFKIVGTTDIRDSAFHHVAVTRSGSTIRLFIDGVQEGGNYTNTNPFTGQQFWIGQNPFGSGYDTWTGYQDEYRILSTDAAWTANFTPESSEYLSGSTEQTITSDTSILATTEQDIFSDTQVVLTFDDNIFSDARISPIHFITSDADIKATVTHTVDSDTAIVFTFSSNILSDARIRAKKDILSDTNIKDVVIEDIFSDTKIIRQVSESIFSDTRVVNKHSGEILSDTIVAQRILKTLTAETIIITPLDLACQLDYLQNKIKDRHFEVEVIQAIPGIPFNVTLQNVGNGDSLRIEWDGTAPYFNVYRVDIGPTYVKINPFLITDHFYVIGGLQENVTYTFIVRGADGRG